MEMVLIFTFCLILAGTDAVTTVTGYRGRSVQIKCPYTSGYEKSKKYFCRGKCSNWIQSNDVPVQSGSPAKDSRFSLYDDTTAKVFTVTITDLRREDEGTYWCGTERLLGDIYTEIQLLVKKNVPARSFVSPTHPQSIQTYTVSTAVHPETTLSTIAATDTIITEYRGRSVQIKCPYKPGYETYNKYLCRDECSTWNHTDVPVQSRSPGKDSRFSLYDDTIAKVFTVTITDLRPEDEGTYWCAIQKIGRDKYTEIRLLVKKDIPALSTVSRSTHPQSTQTHTVSTTLHPKTTLSTRAGTDVGTTVTGYRGRSVQIKCNYTSGYENYSKYLCRHKCFTWTHEDVPVYSGSPVKDSRFSLYDDTTAKVFTVTITDLRPEDGGTYWCAIKQIGPDKYTEILLLVKMDEALSIVSNTTHRQSKTQTHSLSPAVHPEISTMGKADYIMTSTGAMLFTFGVTIALYC